MLIMLLWRWRCRYLFELLFLFPLDIVSGIELLDCVVVLFVTFWGTLILLSVVATPIYNPTNSKKGFLFLCVSTHLFDESHCNRHEVISQFLNWIICFCYWLVWALNMFWMLISFQIDGPLILIRVTSCCRSGGGEDGCIRIMWRTIWYAALRKHVFWAENSSLSS